MVRCGNRLKCWNTMPTSRRTSSIFLRSLVSSTPSTMMRPCWCSSSRLMQRIIVDLPEPEGPQMTMRSRRSTTRLMSRSTWKSPYHLCTSIISTASAFFGFSIFMAAPAVEVVAVSLMVLILKGSAPSRGVDAPLDELRIARHAEAEAEVDQAREREAGEQGRWGRPERIRQGAAQLSEQIEDRHDQHQGGVLEQGDEGVDDPGNDQFERLRQHDQSHHLPIAEAQRHRALELTSGDRLQTAPDHLGHVRGREQRHPHECAQQGIDGPAVGQEQRQH